MKKTALIHSAVSTIESKIIVVRGHKVLLDEELARLYQVQTKVLVQAVKRNLDRFPSDFMFQLTPQEYTIVRSQIVTSSAKSGRRALPYAFNEHGVAMLSSVINSPIAIHVNIEIMRTFVRIRQLAASHTELNRRLDDRERKYDAQFKVVFNSIRELITAKPKELTSVAGKKKMIGFGRDTER